MEKLKIFIQQFFKKKGIVLPKNPLIDRYQHLIFPAISLILTLIILGLVTVPQFFTLLGTYQTLSEIQAEDSDARKKLGQLESIDQKKYKDNLNIALIALPAERDIPSVVDQVLILVSNSGVHLDGINFAAGSDNSSNVPNLQVKLDLSGTENQFNDFLEKAKASPRIMKINSIQYSTIPRNSTVQVSVNLLAFYQELPSNVASDAKTVPLTSETDLKALAEIKGKSGSTTPLSQLDTSNIKTGKSDPFQ